MIKPYVATLAFRGRSAGATANATRFVETDLKESLRGFATVEVPFGLKLIECPVFVRSNGPWTCPPSKPVLDREGKQARHNSKPQFATVVEWRDRALNDRFPAAVVELVRANHPDALAPEAST
jgi:hypothetical protein